MSTTSQTQQILAHLKLGRSITFFEAVDLYGCMHLPRRILDLKELGHDISDVWVEQNGKRFKRWFLKESAPAKGEQTSMGF